MSITSPSPASTSVPRAAIVVRIKRSVPPLVNREQRYGAPTSGGGGVGEAVATHGEIIATMRLMLTERRRSLSRQFAAGGQ